MGGLRAPRNGASSVVAPGKYLSPAGLQQLREYKYVSAPLSSWVDRGMTYYWEWVVNLMPMWLALVDTQRSAQSLTSVRFFRMADPLGLEFAFFHLSLACSPNLVSQYSPL
jgi:hypothetical protein